MESIRGIGKPSPALPATIRERAEVVSTQVDLLVSQSGGDPIEVAKNLREICKSVRHEHPMRHDTQAARQKSRAIMRTLGLANRIADFSTAAAGPGPLSPAIQQTLPALTESLQAALEKIYGSEAAQNVSQVGSTPSKLIDWVEVPGGTFLMGKDKQPVDVPTYWISKHPVTQGQYAKFVAASGHQTATRFEERQSDHPATVNFHDARAFSQWAGGQLPNEAQWEKAGRGQDGRLFPWGNEWDPNACNHDGSDTTSVHHFADKNVSPYGAVDMTGNVYNWIDDATLRRPGAVMMKGGAWGNYARSDRQHYDLAHHTSIMPDSYYGGCGFRVVTTTPPESVTAPDSAGPKAISPSTEPAPQLPRLEPIVKHVQAVLAGTSDQKPLLDHLGALCETLRAESPGGTSKALAQVLSWANRLATSAAFVATGSPAAAASLESCREDLNGSLLDLQRSLRKLQSQPATISAITTGPKSDPGIEWVTIPAGDFLYGRDNQPLGVRKFEIGKYPVTNEQYRNFVEETGYQSSGVWRSRPPGEDEEWADHPAVEVTQQDAQAFCQWVGGRLPVEEEWEKAARGTDGRKFPWGNEWIEGACNNELAGTTSVKKYESVNVSPYGVVDMVGNAMEITASAPSDRPGAILTKGGAWHNFGQKPFNALRHTSEPADMTHGACGFRVARG